MIIPATGAGIEFTTPYQIITPIHEICTTIP